MLYLIEILHQTTTNRHPIGIESPLYLIEILHQTTTFRLALFASMGCILSKFYIKPQLYCQRFLYHGVVSYRNSTSNHNGAHGGLLSVPLYLIEILHQTTTIFAIGKMRKELYLIEILHQTTTLSYQELHRKGCILSKFYIKPQQLPVQRDSISVVSYRNSTSNHNLMSAQAFMMNVVSYRNSTSNHNKG